jgi:hypothetical protein
MSPYWPLAPPSLGASRRWATAVWFGHPRSGTAARKLFLFRGHRRQHPVYRPPNPYQVATPHPCAFERDRDRCETTKEPIISKRRSYPGDYRVEPGNPNRREVGGYSLIPSATSPDKATKGPNPAIASAAVSFLLRDAVNPLEASRTTKPEVGKRRQTWPVAGDECPRERPCSGDRELRCAGREIPPTAPWMQPLHAGVRPALPRVRLAIHG